MPAPTHPLVVAVLAAPVFTANAAPRLSLDRLAALLDALLTATDGTIAPATAAGCLDVPASRLRGAIAQAQRLLNVEGYPVLRADVDGMVVLDVALLREQFGV